MICISCKEQLNDTVLSTNVDGENWCPQCFVWKRAPMEPERFQSGAFLAVECSGCGRRSVNTRASHNCQQCGRKCPIELGPKRGIMHTEDS